MEIRFRPVTRQDFGLLGDWFSRPHVHPWWREPYDPDAVERRYGPSVDGSDLTELYMVEADCRPVGFIQWYRLDDEPEWKAVLAPARPPDRAAGIDYLIGEEGLIGAGLGPTIIGQFVTERWAGHPDIRAVVVDVDQGNRRSWRALEKAGFSRVWAGELPSTDPQDQGPTYVYLRERPTTDP